MFPEPFLRPPRPRRLLPLFTLASHRCWTQAKCRFRHSTPRPLFVPASPSNHFLISPAFPEHAPQGLSGTEYSMTILLPPFFRLSQSSFPPDINIGRVDTYFEIGFFERPATPSPPPGVFRFFLQRPPYLTRRRLFAFTSHQVASFSFFLTPSYPL